MGYLFSIVVHLATPSLSSNIYTFISALERVEDGSCVHRECISLLLLKEGYRVSLGFCFQLEFGSFFSFTFFKLASGLEELISGAWLDCTHIPAMLFQIA